MDWIIGNTISLIWKVTSYDVITLRDDVIMIHADVIDHIISRVLDLEGFCLNFSIFNFFFSFNFLL